MQINNALSLSLFPLFLSLFLLSFGWLHFSSFLSYVSNIWIIITCCANSLFLSTSILWNSCILKLQLFWYGSFHGNNALCISRSVVLSLVSLDVSLPAGSIDPFHCTASAHGFEEICIFHIPKNERYFRVKAVPLELTKHYQGQKWQCYTVWLNIFR